MEASFALIWLPQLYVNLQMLFVTSVDEDFLPCINDEQQRLLHSLSSLLLHSWHLIPQTRLFKAG